MQQRLGQCHECEHQDILGCRSFRYPVAGNRSVHFDWSERKQHWQHQRGYSIGTVEVRILLDGIAGRAYPDTQEAEVTFDARVQTLTANLGFIVSDWEGQKPSPLGDGFQRVRDG